MGKFWPVGCFPKIVLLLVILAVLYVVLYIAGVVR